MTTTHPIITGPDRDDLDRLLHELSRNGPGGGSQALSDAMQRFDALTTHDLAAALARRLLRLHVAGPATIVQHDGAMVIVPTADTGGGGGAAHHGAAVGHGGNATGGGGAIVGPPFAAAELRAGGFTVPGELVQTAPRRDKYLDE